MGMLLEPVIMVALATALTTIAYLWSKLWIKTLQVRAMARGRFEQIVSKILRMPDCDDMVVNDISRMTNNISAIYIESYNNYRRRYHYFSKRILHELWKMEKKGMKEARKHNKSRAFAIIIEFALRNHRKSDHETLRPDLRYIDRPHYSDEIRLSVAEACYYYIVCLTTTLPLRGALARAIWIDYAKPADVFNSSDRLSFDIAHDMRWLRWRFHVRYPGFWLVLENGRSKIRDALTKHLR